MEIREWISELMEKRMDIRIDGKEN